MIRLTLILLLAVLHASPAQAPAPMVASVAADASGFTAAWNAPSGAAFVCVERRSWPTEPDAPIGCYAPVPNVVMRNPRDLNLQLRPGHRAVVTAYDDQGAALGRASVTVGVRWRVWLPQST